MGRVIWVVLWLVVIILFVSQTKENQIFPFIFDSRFLFHLWLFRPSSMKIVDFEQKRLKSVQFAHTGK